MGEDDLMVALDVEQRIKAVAEAAVSAGEMRNAFESLLFATRDAISMTPGLDNDVRDALFVRASVIEIWLDEEADWSPPDALADKMREVQALDADLSAALVASSAPR